MIGFLGTVILVSGFSGGTIQAFATVFVVGMASTQMVACGGGGGGGSATNDVPPPSSTAAAALAMLWKTFDRKKAMDKLKSHFAFKRAEATAAKHTDWAAEPGQPKIVTRVQAELAEVEAFIQGKLGDGSTLGSLSGVGTDPAPHHLDLTSVANYKTGLDDSAKSDKASEYRDLRFFRGSKIVWRAVTVETAVWQAAEPTNPASPVLLDQGKLAMILDRRLRVIERMECNVNAGDLSRSARKWTVPGANGPWRDQQLVRMFEYPSLPYRPFAGAYDDMSAQNWVRVGAQSDPNASLHYEFTRVPLALQPYFRLATPTPDTWMIFHPEGGSDTAATVVTNLLTPNPDFLRRCWFYCDQVLATLMAEALMFSLHRRDGTDTVFNTLIASKPSYLQFGTMIRFSSTETPRHVLMNDDPDDIYFENAPVDLDKLQIGDHVVVWNNAAYDLIAADDWRNEYSLVMDLEGDAQQGISSQEQLKVAGHGIPTRTVGQMLDDLAQQLKSALNDVYTLIAANPAATEIPLPIVKGSTIVRWDPYGEFTSPVWWLRVQPTEWSRWTFTSLDQVRAAFPRCVVAESPAPPRYTSPPGVPDSIFFPLYEPQMSGTTPGDDPWVAYLTSRRTGASGSMNLAPLHVDGKLVAGLFYLPTSVGIPSLRPQVA